MSSISDLSKAIDDVLGDSDPLITAAYVNHTNSDTLHHVKDSSPQYYHSAHQPIETMEANMPVQQFIGYLRGNIIKYACRMGRKDPALKDARKLLQYARWLEQVLAGGYISASNNPADNHDKEAEAAEKE